ncbi:hypothetical protein DEO72_LG1g2542 [Vigna unguiculata]|uniref:Uncharacterized protein n=1 Tax=Vigna unguiculata TaxID=3917 RepID=A0A4D6KYG0_VIGUN|nr:hypothetical protein DEO72_LG1g2540 [Vigna unguiculata]QCD78905.1 hypothetical protein DEO72_LG1g2541 [Vigna unguiculata]QCD78906.1 hypothetical protein DEO72_LG1g2542 [Vigna unguiculata]
MQICFDDVVAAGRLSREASCERGRVLRQRCSTPSAVVGCVSFDSRRYSGGFILLLRGMVDLLRFSWMRCCNGFVNGGWSDGGASGLERNGAAERNG